MYPEHVLVEFGGTLPEPSGQTPQNEIWACGVRCVDNNSQGYTTSQEDFLTRMAPLLATWFNKVASAMASNAALTYLKINNIAPDGKYADPVSHTHLYATPVPGGAAPHLPGFLSLAYTWETGFTRGRAARGRIYPPNFSYSSDGTSDAPSGTMTAAATAGADLLNSVFVFHSTGPENFLQPCVVSRVDGTLRKIIGVTADNTFDVQRRRKNKAQSVRSASIPVSLT